MSVDIRLLGAPGIRRDNEDKRLRGRKAWGLLAYLLLAGDRVPRNRLNDLLFAEADDPGRALRWNLTQLRHALGDDLVQADGGVAIDLPPGSRVDVLVVTSRGWSAALELEHLDRELLEGATFPGCPSFEAWLLNERRHLRACAAAVLREGALGCLSAGRTDAAIGAAVRLVALDPLSEQDQALLIRCYAASGDDDSAARQLSACTDLLRRELGVEPGPAVTQALHASAATNVRTPISGRGAARAQLDAGTAAVRAGRIDAGAECLRRAAAEAHSLGDLDLKAECLLALGSSLAHGGRARHQEGAAALHGALNAARRTERPLVAARSQIELAWIDYLWSRYERCRRWVEGSLRDDPDDGEIRSMALWIRGKCAVEMGSYSQSISDLISAAELAEEIEDPARRSFCLASLGRTYLFMRALDEAREVLNRAIDVGRSHGFVWSIPLAESFLGEVEVLEDRLEAAEDLLQHAYAAAREIGDPSFEVLALRGRGLLAAASGAHDEALSLFRTARSQWLATPDCGWALAYCLDALCGFAAARQIEEAPGWIAELEMLAGRTGMAETLVHVYIYKHEIGVPGALDAANVLGQAIDNPALQKMLKEADPTPRAHEVG